MGYRSASARKDPDTCYLVTTSELVMLREIRQAPGGTDGGNVQDRQPYRDRAGRVRTGTRPPLGAGASRNHTQRELSLWACTFMWSEW